MDITDISRWIKVNRAHFGARLIADRHYNRQHVGAAQFVPPGRCLVLLSDTRDAVWVTSWPYAEYVKHAWPGAWINSLFRNEGKYLTSDLIKDAVCRTYAYWPDVPLLGMVTFIDRDKVRSKKDPGYCYLMAGFKYVGRTKAGLYALQMTPDIIKECGSTTHCRNGSMVGERVRGKRR